MPHVQLPRGVPGIRALFTLRPEAAAPIAELTQRLLTGDSTLTRGERELIGARVSALNGCTFCRESHTALAACLLDDDALVAGVLSDPDSSPASPRLKALLAIADAVQRSGIEVTSAHVERARRAGATDLDIHDTVLIAALFCLFNRYVDGLAAPTPSDPEAYRQRARHVAEHGYRVSPDDSDRSAPDSSSR